MINLKNEAEMIAFGKRIGETIFALLFLLVLLGVVAIEGVDLFDVLQGYACHSFSTPDILNPQCMPSRSAEQNSRGITTGLHTAAP